MRIHLLFLTAILAPAASLTIVPSFISDCTNGLATATVNWSGAAGLVQILVGRLPGTPMTGLLGTSGSAVTGPWVTDGLPFYLVDQSGNIQASATAQVSCGATPRTLDNGLSGGSYFPLAVGNTWVYRYNTRFITGEYLVRTITGTQTIGGQNYFVLTQTSANPPFTVALLRSASNGVIWQSTSTGDAIYLDPNAALVQKTGYSGPLGSFADAIKTTVTQGLGQTISVYVRGLGLATSTANLLTGSSGGFSDGVDLIEVRVDGVHLSIPAQKISLAIDNTDLDLTNKLVTNCAVPCYYVACGLGSPYDPPGVYRPCTRVRIEAPAAAVLQLLDSTGTVVFQSSTTAGLDEIRLPLFTQPQSAPYSQFTLLPGGDYKLVGATSQAASSLTIHIH